MFSKAFGKRRHPTVVLIGNGPTKRRDVTEFAGQGLNFGRVFAEHTDLQQREPRESLGSLLETRCANCAQTLLRPPLRCALSRHRNSGSLAHLTRGQGGRLFVT